jgi:hypothetical protein
MSRPIEVWTKDVCAALREHWGKMPASRIGKILFARDDAGNVVIAQAHRMQLGEGWRPPLRMDERAIKDRARKARARAKNPKPVPKVIKKLAPLLSGRTCSYPMGKPGTKGFKRRDLGMMSDEFS